MADDKYAPPSDNKEKQANEPVRVEPVETKTDATDAKLPSYTPTTVKNTVTSTEKPSEVPATPATPMSDVTPPVKTAEAKRTEAETAASQTISATKTQTATVTKGKNSAIWILLLILALPVLCCVIFFCGTFIFAAMYSGDSDYSQEEVSYTPTPSEEDDDLDVTITPSITPTTTRIASPILRPTETPPSGFTWYSCPTISVWSLRPAGWYTYEEAKDGVFSCYITREQITATQQYQTGLSINVYTNVLSKYGQKASLHAKTVADNFENLGTVTGRTPVTDPDFSGYSLFISSNVGGTVVNQYIAVLGNDDANKLYLIAFESRENTWDTQWATYGKVMIPEIVLPLD
ncbi:MAG: hypothetical protein QY314_02555 [Candidatus Dojkabacteria bacterium]|nr:MAG: hypothetical protein QY314_02555 [Candidatus Dojkabacteria bacterium]